MDLFIFVYIYNVTKYLRNSNTESKYIWVLSKSVNFFRYLIPYINCYN